ncbi:MAG TPA: hybrid sensor histidine kinase/response regulator [Victivallales bacterium]|nr:hybrid sensor histidine kinase/response regulator [Victivallales bacterium]
MNEKLKVLVVDDEPGMRRGSVRALKTFSFPVPDMGFNVSFDLCEAGSGQEFREMMEKNKFDIVLLDYKLPDTNGLELLDFLQKGGFDLLTIMMTAYASIEVAISATKNGAFDFLAKPFTPEELKVVVRKASERLVLQREAKKLAEEKRQIRFQFLSVLSHELKAPLNAIEGYLRLMENKSVGEKISDYEKMIGRSLVRIDGMRKLIFDLLDLTRIESGQKKRELIEFNFTESIKKALETFTPDAGKKNVKISFEGKENIPFWGDPGEMDIIMNNLVSNAIKYNKPDGAVKITAALSGDFLELSVSDTGIGLAPDELERLFSEFVRFKKEATKGVEGSGLGLSILKRISELYNGSINVESEEGKGTTFSLKLKNQRQK